MYSVKRKLIGYAPVDSGQIMICDPCYIKGEFSMDEESWDGIKELLPEGAASLNDMHKLECPDDLPLNYFGACIASCSKDGGGNFSDGVSVRSGYGDGYYPVFVEYIDDGFWGRRVKSVTIEFISDEGE